MMMSGNQPVYKEVIASSDDDDRDDASSSNHKAFGRILLVVGAQHPTRCQWSEHSILGLDYSSRNNSSSNNSDEEEVTVSTIADDTDVCVLGGTVRKLSQFCLQERSRCSNQTWIYGIANFCMFVVLAVAAASAALVVVSSGFECTPVTSNNDGTNGTTIVNGTTTAMPRSETTTGDTMSCESLSVGGIVMLSLSILLSYILFFIVYQWAGRSMTDWDGFEARLDGVIEDLWAELRPTGYSLSRRTNIKDIISCGDSFRDFLTAGTVEVDVKRRTCSSQLVLESSSAAGEMTGTTAAAGGTDRDGSSRSSLTAFLPAVKQTHPVASNNEVDLSTILSYSATTDSSLPVDSWVRGGLMLRLAVAQNHAIQRSKQISTWVVAPVEIVIYMVILVAYLIAIFSDETYSPTPLVIFMGLWLGLSGFFYLLHAYILECVDGAALHRASDHVVSQLSRNVVEERHNLKLQYVIGHRFVLLPKLSKGLIQFQPLSEDDTSRVDPHRPVQVEASLHALV